MAANNYFGFTHGSTQYGAASAAAYPTAQPGYAVTPAAATATYSPQRPATGYETAYQTAAAAAPATYAAVGAGTAAAPASYDYGYGAPAQTAYNTAKTYYQQPAAGAGAYSTAETHYQPYSTTNTYTATTRQTAQGVPKAAAYTTSYSAQPTQPNATSYASGYNSPAVVQTQSNAKSTYNANQANSNAATFTTNYSAASVPNQPAPKTKPANSSYSNYDAAVYSAATLYAAQSSNPSGTSAGAVGSIPGAGVAQSATTAANKLPTGASNTMSSGSTSSWQNNYRKGPVGGGIRKSFNPKQPPKQQQVHYCDVCKISCAGPQTYREHLDGQKHKKKEAMLKAGTATTNSQNALKCELCDVDCTGSDAYAAHIRGARHQKVVKLHTRLGKPIPSTEPVVQGKSGAPVKANIPSNSSSGTPIKKPMTTITPSTSTTPKINFNPSATVTGVPGSSTSAEAKEDDDDVVDKDVQPVGQDYIEEIKNEEGKSTSFMCKLCECRFNDPNAKEMHMKGRRHRLQYKKKVNPELVVEVKPSLRQRKGMEDKQRRMHFREDFMRRRDEERMMRGMMEEEERYWEERHRYEQEMEYFEWCRRFGRDPRPLGPPGPRFGPPGPGLMIPPFFGQPPMMRRPDSMEDRHVIARHTEIYPSEEELSAVQKIVSHSEKALKFVSDHLAEISQAAGSKSGAKPGNPKPTQVKTPATPAKPGSSTPATPAPTATSAAPNASASTPATPKVIKKEDGSDGTLFSFQQNKEEATTGHRLLKGVMRVGSLAKGLLLHGDTSVNLVVLCAEKPTRSLLYKVAENLPKQLQVVAPEDKYSVKCKPEDAALVVIGAKEPHITVTITLTSPVMREQIQVPSAEAAGDSAQAAIVKVKDPPDVLDKQKCLEALAALRHAKWFQARATQVQSCVMIIRILRDLCQRVPTWAPLHNWPMELLVEKVLSSSPPPPLSPGEALRRVMEALASGIMLPGGPGLLDPCEKEPVDAAGMLTPQQREDITASAQHALRLLAFRQIFKVLGMDQLPPNKFARNRFGTRKRRREGSGGEGNDPEAVDGKKDKKDEVVKMETDK
ncbi:zinc finger RNA-binding protein isoform X4 [Frankliniella occidentalis]|uniref:Zinc finger RNA-binding protein isoform X4 n=1 Tax=Frankliniella occidentalis TaxID=133901 RepID=A0A6J1T582_FRAOC|nr:zinc finger RNA-binding protein isoform X4 [Frankliniella occidentalis]